MENHQRFYDEIIIFYFVKEDFYEVDFDTLMEPFAYSKQPMRVYFGSDGSEDYNDENIGLMKTCKSIKFFFRLNRAADNLSKLSGLESSVYDINACLYSVEDSIILKEIGLNSWKTLEGIEVSGNRLNAENYESLEIRKYLIPPYSINRWNV